MIVNVFGCYYGFFSLVILCIVFLLVLVVNVVKVLSDVEILWMWFFGF